MIKKTIAELKNLLSKSYAQADEASAEESPAEILAPDAEVQDETTVKETEPQMEEKSLKNEVELVEINVSKSMESALNPYFSRLVSIFEEFGKSLDSLKKENGEALATIAKALTEVVKDEETLQKSLEELQKRVTKLEETPNTRKSVQSEVEIKERFGKSQADPTQVLTKLTNLAIQGKISPAEVAKFELSKSLESLSMQTRRALETM